jgi:hypothetical protein
LRGGKASVDAWIALRVTFVAAKAFEVILVERGTRRILENMLNGKRASEEQKGRKREEE